MADEEARKKQEERERKKAEVRKRLEEAAKSKKAKKGFMTPERKKKLRKLLRAKAAEELKKEQERKAEERRKVINERCGPPKNLEGVNEATLQAICKEYHARISSLENAKYDLEYEVRQKDHMISELTIAVNDLRGKFVKPPLKKVSKFDTNKLMAFTKKLAVDFRANLKQSTAKKFTVDDDAKEAKPEWALGGKEGKKE
ncbi:troponin I-like isoform X2 [Centruroides sculpturatus]|uniref:troponin I-like isoform X2 n=1 Tax=Centruroides sculpturatus TaxID=218467 RepID=UPI000C6C993F|nr:troponin I-like isoform X2 [Centruroides sculpturatus]